MRKEGIERLEALGRRWNTEQMKSDYKWWTTQHNWKPTEKIIEPHNERKLPPKTIIDGRMERKRQ